jgi:hypothetical protein
MIIPPELKQTRNRGARQRKIGWHREISLCFSGLSLRLLPRPVIRRAIPGCALGDRARAAR